MAFGPRARTRHAGACVSHTAKRPGHCPHCAGLGLTRKGTRANKLEVVQLWQCLSCSRVFTPAPAEPRNKACPLRFILDGMSLYNLGYSLAQAVAKLKSRHGSRVPPSTLAAWNAEHRELATYARLRKEGRRLTPPSQTIRTVKLYHRQVYEYGYHRPKIALLTQSKEHLRYTAGLASFLEAVPKACPHNLFTDSVRASQTAPDFLDRARITWLPCLTAHIGPPPMQDCISRDDHD
jgi:hypothetical protein